MEVNRYVPIPAEWLIPVMGGPDHPSSVGEVFEAWKTERAARLLCEKDKQDIRDLNSELDIQLGESTP